MDAPQTRKTFSYGFITGCTTVLIVAAFVAAIYGMRNYVKTLPPRADAKGGTAGGK